ncbi:MAG: rubredoxin [Candidatus Bathyarchaeia archaeon]
MSRWQCTVCGYIYDPDEGDPESGVDPGTEFGDLPESWECPICGAPKEDFEPL